MKEKIVGILLLLFGLLGFVDAVHPLSIGVYHIRLFLVPFAMVALGWVELHGRHVPFQKRWHHSHVAAVIVAIIIAIIWLRA